MSNRLVILNELIQRSSPVRAYLHHLLFFYKESSPSLEERTTFDWNLNVNQSLAPKIRLFSDYSSQINEGIIRG